MSLQVMHDGQPLISVIVPVYDVKISLVRKCIYSILLQDYHNIELIIIDDGCKEDIGNALDSHAKCDHRVSVLHIPHSGPGAARNAGINRATGNYIGFVDADDYILPNMYSSLLKAMVQLDAEIAGCNILEVQHDGLVRVKRDIPSEVDDFPMVFRGSKGFLSTYLRFSVCNKLFSSRLFAEIRFPEGRGFEDTRTTYKLAMAAKAVCYVPTVGYVYKRRMSSTTGSLSVNQLIDKVVTWDEIAQAVLPIYPLEAKRLQANKSNCIASTLRELRRKVEEPEVSLAKWLEDQRFYKSI